MKLIIDIPEGATHGTVTVVANPQTPHDALYIENPDTTLTLTRTGHVVRRGRPEVGENIIGYFAANAALLGANPAIAGSLGMGGATPYDIGKTGDKGIDMAIQADAFANPEAYGLGDKGGGGLDAKQQHELQPGQIPLKGLSREQIEGVLAAIAQGENQSAKYGPTKLLHELSNLMKPYGITDAGNGCIVPPPSWPELADMTVARAKELAGL